MAERAGLTEYGGAAPQRSADEIRQDIVAERQVLAETVDQLGVRIQEKLDWRSYVGRSPYLALGAAAGAGFLAAGLFKRSTPIERVIDNLGNSLNRAQNKGLFKSLVYGLTSKVATGWIENAIAEAFLSEGSAERQYPPST